LVSINGYLQPAALKTSSSFLSAANFQNLPKQKSNNQIIDDLRFQLAAAGLPAQVVFSSNRDVDILPYHGDKGQSVRYLQKKLQVDSQFTLVCGDSGNDITMFQEQTLGVMVGNSQPELYGIQIIPNFSIIWLDRPTPTPSGKRSSIFNS